jgi:radical SAM protein with 4Fe4S-binding SPASM domain
MISIRNQNIIKHVLSSFKRGYYLNALRMAWDVAWWPDRIYHLPDHLKIEMTTQCNLTCRFCGRTYDIQVGSSTTDSLSRHQQHLSLDAFRKILEQIPDLLSLDIQGTGEPLLHPQFPEILSLCTSKNIAVEFFTNAILLNTAMSERILNASVQRITFSIDAATPKLFAWIRRGARLEQISRNIAHFISLRHTSGRPFPHTRVMMVLSAVNLDEISGVLDLCRGWGIDEMVVTRINVPGPEWAQLEPEEDSLWQAVETTEHLACQYGIQFTIEIPSDARMLSSGDVSTQDKPLPRCLWPWYAANILVDGSVTPCAFIAYSPDMNMGNICNESFGTIWNGAVYKKLRASHRKGTWNNQPCANCKNHVG